MKYLTTIPKTARRAAAVIAAASVAGLITASAAVAASSSGAVLTADATHAAPAAVRACTAERPRRLAGCGSGGRRPPEASTTRCSSPTWQGTPARCAASAGVSAVDRLTSISSAARLAGLSGPGPDRGY